jgi:hypothetical protein
MAEYLTPEQINPTPHQLNTELNSVLDRFPKERISTITGTKAGTDEEVGLYADVVSERRLKSEYGHRLKERIAELVGRASITDHFKEFIIERFAAWMEEGLDPDTDTRDVDKAFFFLDRKHRESGGIFDPTRAVSLERVALACEVRRLTFAQKAYAHIVGDERSRKVYEPKWNAAEGWRDQIRQRYGEEVSPFFNP